MNLSVRVFSLLFLLYGHSDRLPASLAHFAGMDL